MRIFGLLIIVIYTIVSVLISIVFVGFIGDPPAMGHTGVEIIVPLIFIVVNIVVCAVSRVIGTMRGNRGLEKPVYIVAALSSAIYLMAAIACM